MKRLSNLFYLEAVWNYFEAAFFIRNLYQNSVLVLRDEYKTERTYVREYLCDSGSDKNVFETISFYDILQIALLITSDTICAVLHAACKLNPPVIASISSTSPAK